MIETVPGLEQKVAAYARHNKTMNNPATPKQEFDESLKALGLLDRDTRGRARTLFVSRLYIGR